MPIIGTVAFTLDANVLRLAEGGAFGAPTCQATTNVYSEPKSFCPHVSPAFGKLLLAPVVFTRFML
jgi:hypothetical protein